MSWIDVLHSLSHTRISCIVVTLVQVRGHAPRGAGSKMVVTQDEVHGSIGGGNLEQLSINKARALLAQATHEPEFLKVTLNPSGGTYGVQCCGGEVTVLLEPVVMTRPTVAVFGAGHVGWALVQVLGMLPLELHLVDSRAQALDEARLPSPLLAQVHLRHVEVPESIVPALPAGSHVLILTHDHAEDIAILERALRHESGFIGLIGSSAKWAHFKAVLKKQGFTEDDLARVTTPVGLPGVPGKSPQAIAIATAAQLLGVLELPETGF
jgi:xanthine dehydrogenase accessory factor